MPNPQASQVDETSALSNFSEQSLPAPQGGESEGNTLGQFKELAQRRAVLIISIAAIFIGYSTWRIFTQPTVYSGDFRILVEPVSDNIIDEIADPNSVRNNSGGLDYETQIALLRSPTLIQPVVEELKGNYPNINMGTILGGLSINQLGLTKIISVQYQNTNQALTQSVLKALADNYIQYSLNERQTHLRQGREFVDEQLEVAREEVRKLQDELQEFRQVNGYFDPTERSGQLSEQLNALNTQELEVRQQIADLQAQIRSMQTPQGVQSVLNQNEEYQTVLASIQALDLQISTELARFQEGTPVIQALRQQRSNLLPVLEQRAQQIIDRQIADRNVQIELLSNRLNNIQQNQVSIQNEIQQLPQVTREYNNLLRELGVAEGSLENFLQTRQSLSIEAAQSEIPWEIIQQPSSRPLIEDMIKALLTSILLGVALGAGAAFLLDKLDGKYHTLDALKKHVKVPIIGVLPFNQRIFSSQLDNSPYQKHQQNIFSRIKSPINNFISRLSKSTNKLAISLFNEYDDAAEFFESLRVIHSNIEFIMQQRNAKSFVVSSAMVGDGKTTFAINWAETAVAMGQKVLLIDANLRHPQVHKVLGIANDKGLNSVLNNIELDPMDTVQKVSNDKDFYLLSAGPNEYSAMTILTSDKIKYLLSIYERQFDLVIVDVPTASGSADATLFGRCTDGLLLVVNLHRTSRFELKQTLEDLNNKSIPVTGLIANYQKGANPALRENVSQPNDVVFYSDEQSIESSEKWVN